MPPPTIPPATANRLDSEINMLIDDLEQLGDRFSDTINELRDLQNSF
jgi:hypothetical protein